MRILLPARFRAAAVVVAAFVGIGASSAQVITLERPGERDFVLDTAELITPEDEQKIKDVCDRLLTDTASPIVTVTIESMAKHTSRPNMSIESFARTLFDSWGVGHLVINGQASNTGVLLLVSRDDRKSRIELGIGWTYEKEAVAQQIMQNVIVPRFRSGEFSTGIREGVEALEQMARADARGLLGDPSAAPIPGVQGGGTAGSARRSDGGGGGPVGIPGPATLPFGCGCGAMALLVLLAISRMFGGGLGAMNRRGYGYGFPYGWGMGGPASGGGFPSGRSGGIFGGGGGGGGGFGGGFSGGSFGGGFSGGRGASGSW